MMTTDSGQPPGVASRRARPAARGRRDASANRRGDPNSHQREGAAMSRVVADPMMPGWRTGRGPAPAMAVLIEVPRLVAPRSRPARITTSEWPGLRRPPGRWPRRRLRRGVRIAGSTLLALVLLMGAGALGRASLASRRADLP